MFSFRPVNAVIAGHVAALTYLHPIVISPSGRPAPHNHCGKRGSLIGVSLGGWYPNPAAAGAAGAAATAGAAAGAAQGSAAASDPASQATPLFEVGPAPPCHQPMCYSCQSNTAGVPSVTYTSTRAGTHMVCMNPDIIDTARGVAHITAAEASETGKDPANSQWVFSGDVRFDAPEGQMRANTATVQIVNQRIASITAQGSPALFQRLPNPPLGAAEDSAPTPKSNLSSLTVHGHAQSITYDAAHNQVQFSGNSWFTDGCNDITSDVVTYNMMTQTVQAGAAPGSHARVRGTVRNTRPGSSTGCSAATGSTPTAGAAQPRDGTMAPDAARTP